jgi:hypothetical protein
MKTGNPEPDCRGGSVDVENELDAVSLGGHAGRVNVTSVPEGDHPSPRTQRGPREEIVGSRDDHAPILVGSLDERHERVP